MVVHLKKIKYFGTYFNMLLHKEYSLLLTLTHKVLSTTYTHPLSIQYYLHSYTEYSVLFTLTHRLFNTMYSSVVIIHQLFLFMSFYRSFKLATTLLQLSACYHYHYHLLQTWWLCPPQPSCSVSCVWPVACASSPTTHFCATTRGSQS